MDRTVSSKEHYVQVGFYQNIIKELKKENLDLKKTNNFLQQENEVLKAKLEVEHSNNLMRL
tara:strand:- start:5501 stop:5683 length:183 start_codon:yes stop_codon:yes gene_type:complete